MIHTYKKFAVYARLSNKKYTINTQDFIVLNLPALHSGERIDFDDGYFADIKKQFTGTRRSIVLSRTLAEIAPVFDFCTQHRQVLYQLAMRHEEPR